MNASQILDASLHTETAHFERQGVLCVSTYASSTANPFKEQQSDGERLVHKREANSKERAKAGRGPDSNTLKKEGRHTHKGKTEGG